MKKIPTLYERDWSGDRFRVLDVLNPSAAWVVTGEGRATRKWDGTACLVRDGRLFKRYDAKAGKTPPPGFEPAQAESDPETGHWPGWLPVGNGPEDRWHRDAKEAVPLAYRVEGTYELVGPKVNGNAEHFSDHTLIRHGIDALTPDPPRDFDGLAAWLAENAVEGIVWHHPDGRMAKIKRRDFGLPWPVKQEVVS